MKTSCDMVLEQRQKLVLTPGMLLNMHVLQIPTLELDAYIQKKLQENPFLEECDYHETERNKKPAREDKRADGEIVNNQREKDRRQERLDNLLSLYPQSENTYSQGGWAESSPRDPMVQPSLYEHLDFQLLLETKDRKETAIGRYLIGNLDEAGYLTLSLEDASKGLGIDITEVEKVLGLIQTFHPHGVGARSLAECILLQLKHYGKETELIPTILENHIEDLAKGRLPKIAASLNISIREVQAAWDLLREVNPKPGLQYKGSTAPYIRPDVFVVKDQDEYHLIINDNGLPRLRLNQKYLDLMGQPELLAPETRDYLREYMESAFSLMRSIQQRQISLYKVARCILDYQRAFLEHGIERLKPLTMREVAEQIALHESTVSRAVRNKYIQTPRGLYEMKYFFGAGVEGQVREGKVSAKKVKHLIEQMVCVEDTASPYNDNKIVSLLHEKGISVSRRTVAKYRQELGIPSIAARKRYE
ncbi:MAG: RNA polymerase factor sigma-54 [Peptococcaceae bacterium]|nr:RNA polymerase factor sigma-54 [Peptococcaceae bacterium]